VGDREGDGCCAAAGRAPRSGRCVARLARPGHALLPGPDRPSEESHAHELLFSLRFLDAIADDDREADRQLARLVATIPPSGRLPAPNTPIGRYPAAGMVEADLGRMAKARLMPASLCLSFSTAERHMVHREVRG
jgi:hypothetical protein